MEEEKYYIDEDTMNEILRTRELSLDSVNSSKKRLTKTCKDKKVVFPLLEEYSLPPDIKKKIREVYRRINFSKSRELSKTCLLIRCVFQASLECKMVIDPSLLVSILGVTKPEATKAFCVRIEGFSDGNDVEVEDFFPHYLFLLGKLRYLKEIENISKIITADLYFRKKTKGKFQHTLAGGILAYSLEKCEGSKQNLKELSKVLSKSEMSISEVYNLIILMESEDFTE